MISTTSGFIKYQHLERYGTTEVQNIELGTCYVFPKIDGSNGCVWLDENGEVKAGSRKRELTLEKDNAGFNEWVLSNEKIKNYLLEYPTHRLYGEWLVPHSLKTYRNEAWRNFYIFDVAKVKNEDQITHEGDSRLNYLHYELYVSGLEKHQLNFIAPLAIINNGSYEQFINWLHKNVYLIQDGKGVGEGIVLKNYDWKNKYNRQTWAKIVTSEFKEKHNKEMGPTEVKGKKLVEDEIAKEFVTSALIEKVYAKICLDQNGWRSAYIPRLLNTVYYDLVREESWSFVKKHKNPIIDYKKLQHFVFAKVKETKPELF